MTDWNIDDPKRSDKKARLTAPLKKSNINFPLSFIRLEELPSDGNSDRLPIADNWVCGIDSNKLRVGGVSGQFGKSIIFIAIISAFAVGTFFFIVSDAYFFIFFMFFLGFSFLWSIRYQSGDTSILFDRKKQKAFYYQKFRLVEVDWQKLRPFFLQTYSTSAVPSWHLVMIDADINDKLRHYFILKSGVYGALGALAYYEYIHRFMNGHDEGLPETHVLPGPKRPFWMQFRYNFCWMFNGNKGWSSRTKKEKTLMCWTVPLITFVSWPIAMFPLVSIQIGKVRKFPSESKEHVDQPLGDAIQSRMHHIPPVEGGEKVLYVVSFAVAAVFWIYQLSQFIYSIATTFQHM